MKFLYCLFLGSAFFSLQGAFSRPITLLAGLKASSAAAGENKPTKEEAAEKKHIEIDLTEQRLRAFDGDDLVYDFAVSSGVRQKTPDGIFRIWKKYQFINMESEYKALSVYYYLPNVPYVMFYFNEDVPKTRGFAIHGTYWHNKIGRPMSHGCINMKIEEARKLFFWAHPVIGNENKVIESDDNPGTKVVVHGKAPDR